MRAKGLPRINERMTEMPLLTTPQTTVEECHRFMRREGFNHLPVVEHGKTVGVVSDRDLRGSAGGNGALGLKVADVMAREVYAVGKAELLVKVVKTMAKRRIGCCIVVDTDRKPIGIFTVTDALALLADVLDGQAPPELRVGPVYDLPSRRRARGADGTPARRPSK